jgi:hypothetical protein
LIFERMHVETEEKNKYSRWCIAVDNENKMSYGTERKNNPRHCLETPCGRKRRHRQGDVIFVSQHKYLSYKVIYICTRLSTIIMTGFLSWIDGRRNFYESIYTIYNVISTFFSHTSIMPKRMLSTNIGKYILYSE